MFPQSLIQLRRWWWSYQATDRTSRWGINVVRAVDSLICALMLGRISLWAMSLVYTTLLSLTPMLALAFSLLKALGVHNSLEPLLLETLKGLGPQQAQEVTSNVIRFVSNVNVGVLGFVGVTLLVYSALSLIQKMEAAFNEIWRVEKPRPIYTRISQYLAVLMVGPVVMFSALGLTASALNSSWVAWLTQVPVLGFFFHGLASLLPYALIIGMFTFLYGFVPQARVTARAALAGGLVAGLLWQSASYIFAHFVAGATNYNAIYSGFAVVIVVLIWLYLGWLILLSGCQLAYFTQHSAELNPYAVTPKPHGRAREQLALSLLALVAQRFLRGAPPAIPSQLGALLGVEASTISLLAADWTASGLLAESQGGWLLARDPAAITMAQAWQMIRGIPLPGGNANTQAAGAWLEAMESVIVQSDTSISLKDWVSSNNLSAVAGEKTNISQ
jgi:membrane protein